MKKINILELMKGIGLLLLYFLIPNLISYLLLPYKEQLGNNLLILIYGSTYLILLCIIFFVYKDSLKNDFENFKINHKNDLKIGLKYWLFGILFMIVTNASIILIFGKVSANEQANRSMISSYPILSFLSMALIGPFLEEMLFRKSFRNAFTSKIGYCLFTAFLFGSMHLIASFTLEDIYTNLYQLLFIIPYSGIGYFFALAYLKTDNIFTSIFMHIFHNTLSVLLVILGGI